MADFSPSPRAVPTTVTGSRGPETDISTRLVADVKEKVFKYMPTATPLTVFTAKVQGRRTVHQYKYDVLSLDQFPRGTEVSTTYDSDDTSIVVASGTGSQVPTNAVLVNLRTDESIYVTGVSTDTLTVERAFGGTTGQGMVAGDVLLFTRAVFEDGAGKPSYKSVKTATDYNYTEILKTGVAFTGRDLETEFYGGNDPDLTRKWAAIEHLKSIELMMFFGRRHLRSGTHLTTFSGGADFFVRDNIWNLNDEVPTERAFIEFLEVAMREGQGGFLNGSGVKYLFSSARWMTEISFWAKDRLRYVSDDRLLGIDVKEYLTPHGKVLLVHTPILDEFHKDRAYLFDLNHVAQTVHRGRNTKLFKNVQDNDIDGVEEFWMSDVGAQYEAPDSHAILKGLRLSD